jgi:hypothetical protein
MRHDTRIIKCREDDATIKHYQANIWLTEKGRGYPRVKYYEAETKKEVTAMVKEEFPDCKEFLVIEALTPPRETQHLEIEN